MKKIIALLTFTIGGSVCLFLATLSGCRRTEYAYFFKDVKVGALGQKTDTSLSQIQKGGDTCLFQSLSFSLSFQFNVLAGKNNGIDNSLYAFQPGNNHFDNIDKIKSIRLINLFPYNQFSEGSNITELIEDTAGLRYNLNQELSEPATEPYRYIEFKLKSPPGQLSKQQFVLELVSENNTLLRDTTVMFYLKP